MYLAGLDEDASVQDRGGFRALLESSWCSFAFTIELFVNSHCWMLLFSLIAQPALLGPFHVLSELVQFLLVPITQNRVARSNGYKAIVSLSDRFSQPFSRRYLLLICAFLRENLNRVCHWLRELGTFKTFPCNVLILRADSTLSLVLWLNIELGDTRVLPDVVPTLMSANLIRVDIKFSDIDDILTSRHKSRHAQILPQQVSGLAKLCRNRLFRFQIRDIYIWDAINLTNWIPCGTICIKNFPLDSLVYRGRYIGAFVHRISKRHSSTLSMHITSGIGCQFLCDTYVWDLNRWLYVVNLLLVLHTNTFNVGSHWLRKIRDPLLPVDHDVFQTSVRDHWITLIHSHHPDFTSGAADWL